MKAHYIDFLIFGLSAALLIFAIMLWHSRPKIDSSKDTSQKKLKKNKEQPKEEPDL